MPFLKINSSVSEMLFNGSYSLVSCYQVKAPVENKSTKPRMNSSVNYSPVHKHISREASKTEPKNQNRKEKESPMRSKLEKQSPRTATPVRRPVQRPSKPEVSLIIY